MSPRRSCFIHQLCQANFSFYKVSEAPPPASQAQSKIKFEMGKKYVSEEQRKKEQMERMFAAAKNVEGEEVKPKAVNPEDEEVAEDEWND
jgi:coronin-7